MLSFQHLGSWAPILDTPYQIQVVDSKLCEYGGAILSQVKRVHELCFPDEVPESGQESSSEFLKRVTWMTEIEQCTWYLLWQESPTNMGSRLVGLATTTPYTSSLYGFNLGVVPDLRGRGLGRRLMHEVQREALNAGSHMVVFHMA